MTIVSMGITLRESAVAAIERGDSFTCSIDEACYLTGLSRSHLYRAMQQGKLLFLIVGRTRRIERESLRGYVHALCLTSTPELR